jgi:hypothetical protein
MAKDAGGHGSESRGGGDYARSASGKPGYNPKVQGGLRMFGRQPTPAEAAANSQAVKNFSALAGAAHSSGIAQATAPITEHQQVPGGNKTWASNYAYQGVDKASGLHKFSESGGKTELFAKRSTAPSGWHLSRGASKFEFVRSS